jgi:hypothetical protein
MYIYKRRKQKGWVSLEKRDAIAMAHYIESMWSVGGLDKRTGVAYEKPKNKAAGMMASSAVKTLSGR